MSDPASHRIEFLCGGLAAFASSGHVVTYDEVRRLCRFNDGLLGTCPSVACLSAVS